MVGLDRDALREALKRKGLTARAASLLVGENAYLVRDILAGRSKNPRLDTIGALASVLDVPISTFAHGDDTPPRPAPPQSAMLPIMHRVQAGAWLAVDDTVQDEPEPRRYPAAIDPRFPRAAQWLSEIVGDSMDALYIFEGDLVHCVDATEIGYAPRTGDIVEVSRTRFGGRETERTVKQVEVSGKHVRLWPRSKNPRWTQPLDLALGTAANEEIEVRISGLVLSSIRRFGG